MDAETKSVFKELIEESREYLYSIGMGSMLDEKMRDRIDKRFEQMERLLADLP